MSNQRRRTGKSHGRRGGGQKRTTPEDVSIIFRYRGAGFSQDEIAEITGLSRQTVSYQLKKMRLTAIKGNIVDVVRSQGLIDRDPEMLDEIETLQSNISDLELELEELDALISSSDFGSADNVTGEPEIEPDTVVIDASNVLFQTIATESKDSDQPDIDVRASPHSLKFMIDYFEDEGRRVHCRMRKSTYWYLLSHAGLDEFEGKLLRSLVDSGKMELVGRENDQLFNDIQATIISNDQMIQGGSRILPYQWIGSELVIPGLHEFDQKSDAEHAEEGELDSQTIAREVVFSMIADGEYIPVPNIHYKLASTFLGLSIADQINWKKGWPAQLKEELNLSGKGFADQISRLMGDKIEFNDERQRVRKR
jgi:transcriptional regulator with XRE-family HTH domain|tara:strand:- start:1812 stop:2909 length:1098 start_codon:yes stop_codon:yes gene_type:complete